MIVPNSLSPGLLSQNKSRSLTYFKATRHRFESPSRRWSIKRRSQPNYRWKSVERGSDRDIDVKPLPSFSLRWACPECASRFRLFFNDHAAAVFPVRRKLRRWRSPLADSFKLLACVGSTDQSSLSRGHSFHSSILMCGQDRSIFRAEVSAESQIVLQPDSGSLAQVAHRTSRLLSFRFHQSDGRFEEIAAAKHCAGHFAGKSGDP